MFLCLKQLKILNRCSIYNSRRSITEHNAIIFQCLSWKDMKSSYSEVNRFKAITFNLLAPVYKRLSAYDISTGQRKRESNNNELWRGRVKNTIKFFREEIYNKASIIALQEYWIDQKYSKYFEEDFIANGYDFRYFKRIGPKLDAVALIIKKDIFDICSSKNIHLCSVSDRVALLLWVIHKPTNKNILIANTHLSFPHTNFDKLNQVSQMKNLTSIIDDFARENNISNATKMVMGDFNVENNSPVCDLLRNLGYYSCFEVSPPEKSLSYRNQEISEIQDNLEFENQQSYVNFISHRNHRLEELGVDHIFLKPEYEVGNDHIGPHCSNEDHQKNEDADLNTQIFVEKCEVLPQNIEFNKWDEKFAISDHRPVSTTLVLAKLKDNNAEL